MTKVILHGLLGKEFGETHEFFIRKPIDAIKALMANKAGFRHALRTWGREGRAYQMICDGEVIDWDNQLSKEGKYQQIDIVPTIVGASDELKIVIGVILIVASFIVPGMQGWGQSLGGKMLAGAMLAVGMSLVMMGIMGLLYPTPTPSFESSPQAKSFMFSGTTNAQVQGVPIPVAYGRLRIGSKVISTFLRPQRMSGPNSNSNYLYGTQTHPIYNDDWTDYVQVGGGQGGWAGASNRDTTAENIN